MRNLKKILALVLVLVMAMSFASAAYADADKITASYDEAVTVMSYAGIFNGIDGEFQPQGNLTREQAMKIVAYMLLGQYKADNLPKDIKPFADVEAGRWSAGVIAYCANKGIVSGDGTGNFNPTGDVTGYEFAKMVMGAAGITGEFTGESWKFAVAIALDEYGLLTNLGNVVLSEPMTREQACQLAFNALQVSVTGNYTGNYVVYATADTTKAAALAMDEEVFESRADAIVTMNALGCALETDYTVEPETDDTAALYHDHDLYKANTYRDAFGFRSKQWYTFDADWNKVVIYEKAHSAQYESASGVVTCGQLFSALGLTKYDDALYATIQEDGAYRVAYDAENDVYYTDTVKVSFNDKDTKIGGNGVSVTAYYNPWYETLHIVEVTTFVGVVSNPRDAQAETATKLPTPAMVDITVGDVTYTDIETEAYEDGDVVLVTIAGGEIQSHELATPVVGKLDKHTANTITVSGTTYKKADAAVKMIGTDVDPFNNNYVYYTDGINVYDCEVYNPGETKADGYAYVIGWQVTADGFSGDLFNGAVDYTAAAKAQIVNLDGSVEVVDLAVTYDKYDQCYYVDAPNGAKTPITKTLVDAGFQSVCAWSSYELVEGEVDFIGDVTTEDLTIAKGTIDVTVGEKSFTLNSKTVYNYYNVKDGTESKATGYRNIKVAADQALIIADRYGVVSNIYVVKTTTDYGTSYADLAVAVESGATYSNGTGWTFYINGDVEGKVVATDVIVVPGEIYELTINDKTGVVTAVEALKDADGVNYNVFTMTQYTVTMIDDSYIKAVDADGNVVNFTLDAEHVVYNAYTGEAAEIALKTVFVAVDFCEDLVGTDYNLFYVFPAAE